MTEETPPNGLNAVLYFLHYVTKLSDDPILPKSLIQQIKFNYKPELAKMMCASIKWSIDNPEFDFTKQLSLNYKNSDIYFYLKKVNKLFEDEGIYSKYL